jgi:hypothetical protein
MEPSGLAPLRSYLERFWARNLVAFAPTDDGRTLVELEHRDLEAYGEKAEQMRETFEGPEAWGGMLKIYRDVAEASA